jgi:cytochrome b561
MGTPGGTPGGSPAGGPGYSLLARRLHWWTVALLGVQIPVGLFMVRYGAATNFAAPSGTLYDGHKLLGLALLLLVAVRLGYRLGHGAPSSEPSLTLWQRAISHANHWAIYALLFIVPLIGWLAISYYGPFRPFGIALPVLVAENGERAKRFFALHQFAAYALIALIGMHIAAALWHYLIRKDGVMRRMLVRAALRC